MKYLHCDPSIFVFSTFNYLTVANRYTARETMHQRRSTNGRPSGTDGSDFSYRMVVDSRYKKVAKGKSRLSKLIFFQAVIQFSVAVNVFFSAEEEGRLDRLAVTSTVTSFVSLLIGEIGRKRSRSSFLKFLVFGSSIALLLSLACLAKSKYLLEIISGSSGWETSKFRVLKTASMLLALVLHLFLIGTARSLIYNMAPPKRAS